MTTVKRLLLKRKRDDVSRLNDYNVWNLNHKLLQRFLSVLVEVSVQINQTGSSKEVIVTKYDA
jgi:predicted transcriptional regulator